MILFYGAPNRYEKIKSADQVGSGRKGEENRPDFRDMVFLTSDFKTARYYGRYVYKVKAEAIPYWKEYEFRCLNKKMNRKRTIKNIHKKVKSLKKNETIFVANPESIEIIHINKCECRNKNK